MPAVGFGQTPRLGHRVVVVAANAHDGGAKRGNRPLLKTGDPKETIARLLAARTQYYERAELIIDSRPGGHARTVAAIVAALADAERGESVA